MLNIRFKPFLNKLLVELLDCWQRKSPQILRVESAYMITLRHWKEIKGYCWQKKFDSEEDEINFFKNIKCEFIGRLNYYAILYEALVSAPQGETELRLFWESEYERYDRFLENHSDFITYLNSGNDQLDRHYFLRQNMSIAPPIATKIYDGDPDFSTQYDHLVSAFFAERLYRHYLLTYI